ncbi:MAG: 1-acyl-sn-glycerol-3-phosphate acyltransferase [Fluviicola sp.]|nr:1-acyl-sn-glycerol-3-phosphate acyltransferase [Fluviicola sp.]
MLYRFIKVIIGLAIRFYYKEIRVVDAHYLDEEGPIIIIANHPNTLMDAWIMGHVNKRRVNFMAKATFFSSPLKRKLLGALGIIPINRKADGATEGVSNAASFDACYQLLENGGVLVVFPEGTSYLERKLRELKTGTARIALEVEKRNAGKLNVKIIPIGLNYIDADSFRGKVMVHVGKPIDIDPSLLAEYTVSQGKAAKQLTERFRIELSRVFVTMDDQLKEEVGNDLRALFDTKYAPEKDGVNSTIQLLRDMKARMDEYSVVAPWKVQEIHLKSRALNVRLASAGIRSDFLDRSFRKTLYTRQYIQTVLFLIAAFPIFLFGLIHNGIQYFLIGKLVPKLTNEVEYHAPLVVLLGLVLYPAFYVLIAWGVNVCLELTWIQYFIYLGVLPFSGLFAHYYLKTYHHMRSKRKFSRFVTKRKAVFEELKNEREALKSLIFND